MGQAVIGIYCLAAMAEILGCFAFWAVFRQSATTLWLLPGGLALGLFAYLLTLGQSDIAGRAFAGYGGIYIATALVWLWLVEGRAPDRYDFAGGILCIVGAAIILLAPRGQL